MVYNICQPRCKDTNYFYKYNLKVVFVRAILSVLHR